MAALDQTTSRELNCGEREAFRIGETVEVTVLEIDGDAVVLRLDGVEESQVVSWDTWLRDN